MTDPEKISTISKPEPAAVKIAAAVAPASPYDFENLLSQAFTIVRRDGTPIVEITCHEATGKESAALAIIARVESAACDAFYEARGGKLERNAQGREFWKFSENTRFTMEENNFLAFRRRVYPKLIACSTCNVERLPTAEETWRFPEEQIEKWYAAALKTNPAWFDEFRQIPKEQILEEMSSGNGSKKYKKKSH